MVFCQHVRAQQAGSGQLAPDPVMAIPSNSTQPDSNSPAADSGAGTGADTNAGDNNTATTSSNGHIIVKPKLNIETDKNPMTDDDALLKLIASMPDGVQKTLMDEAQHAREYCEYNAFLHNFYSCSCFSLKVVGQRIANGPDMPFYDIMNKTQLNGCIDDASIAGYGYQKCNDIMNGMPITTEQLDNICSCTGRAMATNFSRNPNPNYVLVNQIFTNVLTYCRGQYGF